MKSTPAPSEFSLKVMDAVAMLAAECDGNKIMYDKCIEMLDIALKTLAAIANGRRLDGTTMQGQLDVRNMAADAVREIEKFIQK